MPKLIQTLWIYFLPKKFLFSTREPFSWISMLMGQWAHTDLILYRKPRVSPWVTFSAWVQIVWTVASSFPFPHHLSPLLFPSMETEFYIGATEVPPQGASGTLHNSCASLQSEVDIFWNVDSPTAEKGLPARTSAQKLKTTFLLTWFTRRWISTQQK